MLAEFAPMLLLRDGVLRTASASERGFDSSGLVDVDRAALVFQKLCIGAECEITDSALVLLLFQGFFAIGLGVGCMHTFSSVGTVSTVLGSFSLRIEGIDFLTSEVPIGLSQGQDIEEDIIRLRPHLASDRSCCGG